MNSQALNRGSGIAVIALAAIALLVVLSGYVFPGPPQKDEGTQAHMFQLSVALEVPALLVFLATCEWKARSLALRPLVLAAIFLLLAFVGLFHLEHP